MRSRQVSTSTWWLCAASFSASNMRVDAMIVGVDERVVEDERRRRAGLGQQAPEAQAHQHGELLLRALAQPRDVLRRGPPAAAPAARRPSPKREPRLGEDELQIGLEPVAAPAWRNGRASRRGRVELAGEKLQGADLLLRGSRHALVGHARRPRRARRRVAADVVGAVGLQLAFDAGLGAAQLGKLRLGAGDGRARPPRPRACSSAKRASSGAFSRHAARRARRR